MLYNRPNHIGDVLYRPLGVKWESAEEAIQTETTPPWAANCAIN